MHADAQKLIQQVGRVGRPDGENFFGRVGQCFYHVTRNTSEWHLFQSAIKKYQWMRTALAVSETWPEPGANEAASASESGA
jgi:ERCC4-related helicase